MLVLRSFLCVFRNFAIANLGGEEGWEWVELSTDIRKTIYKKLQQIFKGLDRFNNCVCQQSFETNMDTISQI